MEEFGWLKLCNCYFLISTVWYIN